LAKVSSWGKPKITYRAIYRTIITALDARKKLNTITSLADRGKNNFLSFSATSFTTVTTIIY
jgi:hypothetical protein